ncbi:hypothetical protein FRC08_007659 [Ceratobasidium sp. 394]|nr:hypothetical protein FRC08_007659 [Ceratobasidium sp. 394]
MSLAVPRRKAQHGTGRAHIHTFGGQAHFSELSYTYPLKLLSPDIPSHGEIPTGIAYVLSYGGGLVSGDRIDLNVQAEEGTGLVFLTQGSTKVFKSRTLSDRHRLASITPSSTTTSQHLTVTLSPSSLFLLLPDPVTPFESASYTQIQTFTLAPTSSLVLLDWFTSGRMARGEEWAFERYYSRNEVFVGGKRVARDVMLLEQVSDDKGTHGLPVRRLKDRLAPYACYATLLLVGPQTRELITSFQSAYNLISQRQRAEPEDLIWSLSPLTDVNAGACIRVAGTETELVKDWLKTRMEGLGRIVGQDVYNKAFV